jgi:hypothetical protein
MPRSTLSSGVNRLTQSNTITPGSRIDDCNNKQVENRLTAGTVEIASYNSEVGNNVFKKVNTGASEEESISPLASENIMITT